MALKHSLPVEFLVYVAVRVVVCVLQALPYETCLRLSTGFAWLMYKVDRRHRLVAGDNLRHAFPEISDDGQREALVRAVYRHFVGLMVVLVHLPRLFYASTWKRYFDMPQSQVLLSALLSGRPVMMLTGHFGNWELGGYVLGVLGFRAWVVARPLDNPYLHRYLLSFRRRHGQTVLAKKGDFERIQDVLEQGGLLATLGDQDAGQRGLYVDFFNRPASTHKAIALMALEYQTPIVVMGIARVGEPMRHHLLVADVVLPEEYAGRPDAVKVMTQRCATALEQLIRRYPEQYFWLHRRWKHQPKTRKERAA
jgi:KDO2-lipid IV(A) lauroyltransferase